MPGVVSAAKHGEVATLMEFIAGGASLNSQDGVTALAAASYHGHVDCVRLLLEGGANVDLPNEEGQTALYCAAYTGHLDCVTVLLDRKANVDLMGNDGRTPLHCAAHKGHLNCVKVLLKFGANVNLADNKGQTPLSTACDKGRIDCMKLLLVYGANVDVVDKDGRTPLLTALAKGRMDCTEFLLNGNANANLLNKDKKAPLHLTASIGHVGCLKLLLKSGAKVDLVDKSGGTPLYIAASNGQVACVKLLLESGAKINLADEQGWTALYIAASSDHVDCVKLLLESGAKVDLADKGGETPLYIAASNGHVACVKLLLGSGAKVDLADERGWTPLSFAASNGHVDCVKLLLEGGAKVDLVDECGETPLYIAASNGHVDCVKLLFESGAKVDLADERGWTALSVAASNGHVHCVKLLLEGGAKVDLANKGGETPLYIAASNGRVDCVKLLLESGAKVDLADEYGGIPLSIAASKGRVNCVKLLLESGAKVDLADEGGETPLYIAASNGHVDCLKLLLESGAKINLADEQGWTALYIAASNGRVDCVKLLLESGAKVDLADKGGGTPLYIAASNGHVDCVKLLLESGAKFGLFDKGGQTLLYIAASNGHVDCVMLLFESGAKVDLADEYGGTPLSIAASNGHVDCVKLLLESGAKVDLVDEYGETPLYIVASNGHVDCVKLLLASGAKADLADERGWTPLCIAASNGHVDCVKLLLEGGAKVDLADKYGWTPLYIAASNGRVDCVKLLLESGAKVDLADEGGQTLLYIAASNGHVDCVKLLLESGVKIDLADKYGQTPLSIAASNGHVDCLKLLLEGGAKVDLANKYGETPLYIVASNGHVDCVKLLLESGAKVDLTDKAVGTPLQIALLNKQVDTSLELIENGAKIHRGSLFGSNPYAFLENKGRTILHEAIESGRSKKCILHIIEAYPKALKARDHGDMTPLDTAIQCGADLSILWLLFQHQNNVSSTARDAFPLLCAATRMSRRTIQLVHIHLVGHGFAGKTTCRKALNKTLKHLRTIAYGVFPHKEVSVPRTIGSGKTEGMEMDSIETPHHKWLIRDYGGQEDFHVNHARFLSVPGSIYVIVVALWDEEGQCIFNVNEIKSRFMYWLKFLNSIADKDSTMKCLVVANFKEKVSKQHSADCVLGLEQCFAEWRASQSSVTLHGNPCLLSVCNVNEVVQWSSLLTKVADSARDENLIPVLSYIDAIDTSFSHYVSLQQGKIDRRSKFVESVCLPAVNALIAANSPPPKEHIAFVCDKMIEYLCTSGKIIVVPNYAISDDPLIVLDVNWLSKELLGSLINKLSESGRDEFVLTAKEINTFTNNGSEYFGGVEGLVSFLESIGACIAVNRENDVSSEVKRWFPLCGQKKFIVGEECVAMVKETWNTFRKVVRLFKLSDPVHQMFPPGYFIDLFLKIVSSFSMEDASIVKVFINGMEVRYQFADTRMQILLVVFDDNCSFTLEVSYASRLATSTSFSKEECWKRFIEICEIIMNPREVYAAKDIIRASPWFDNVNLTEMFVNPTNEALWKAQQQKNNSMEVKEFRNIKSLVDLLEDRNKALQNLYILGCDESDMPVSDTDPPPHILELISGKVDNLQQQLNERWNTVTVTVSSDLIQESFKVMMNTLKDSMSTELHDMIVASRQAMCENSLSMSNLQSVVDKLRSDISEKITSESAQVLTELNQAQKLMKELTDEVHNIQHLNDKALQSAILNAFNESKALLRIDNMLQTVLKGTHDVPTMAIVIPVVKKGSLLSSFNPSDWTSNEYSLYFVCSHSHQVVACGPDGKGYRFRRAKEWFKKVAPVIKVCLIAAKIALTITGIPIPVNGVVESLDQITAVASTTQYLNSALSIVDAVDSISSDVGISIGDQGSAIDDTSPNNAEQYVKSLNDLLGKSDTIEAYKSLKALLDEVDPTLSSVGVEKMTSESGRTGWVKKGDQVVIDSFLKDAKWPLKIDELKNSYDVAATAPEAQSKLGERIGLWLPKSLLGKKK